MLTTHNRVVLVHGYLAAKDFVDNVERRIDEVRSFSELQAAITIARRSKSRYVNKTSARQSGSYRYDYRDIVRCMHSPLFVVDELETASEYDNEKRRKQRY